MVWGCTTTAAVVSSVGTVGSSILMLLWGDSVDGCYDFFKFGCVVFVEHQPVVHPDYTINDMMYCNDTDKSIDSVWYIDSGRKKPQQQQH